MRNIDDIVVGRRKTPLILVGSRFLFAALFMIAAASLYRRELFPASTLDLPWLLYIILIYLGAEWLYASFKRKNIDLTFAFPLLFVVLSLHLVSVWLDGQTRFPLMNRAEHFASFVLITYAVWVFFLQYLPHQVWRHHPYYTALLVFSVISALGSVNEIVELALERVFASRLVGDRLDTSLDLLMNSLGAGMFLAVRLILGAAEKQKRIRY